MALLRGIFSESFLIAVILSLKENTKSFWSKAQSALSTPKNILSIPTKLAQTSISKPTLLSLNTKLILLKDTTQILEFCYQLLSSHYKNCYLGGGYPLIPAYQNTSSQNI